MGKIADLRKRSNAFVSNLPIHLATSIEQVEQKLVDLNREQMLKSRLSTGAAIRPKYSPAYAIKKGFTKPNLFVTGEFQSEMFLSFNENNLTYFIASFDFKTPFLRKFYGDNIFGIETDNRSKAHAITTPAIAIIYKQKVFRG